LNHENWNAEEAPEEAGQFRQAGQAALAGRVIKTARRRRPVGAEEGEQAPKSAFAGFGGFAKPASTDATAAFSFLGKSTTESSTPSTRGFAAFGSNASSPPAAGSFSFGSSKPETVSDPPAAKKSSVFGSFSSGGEQKPSFGSTASEPKSSGFGAFSFGAKTEDKPPPEKESAEVSKSMFKPVESEVAKAGEETSPSSGFSFGAVTSTANTGGFSFGAASSNKVEENKENNAGSAFSFGSKNPGTEKGSLGAFQFGGKPKADDAPSASSNGGFSFGAKVSTEQIAKNDGFSFGANSSAEETPKGPATASFSFGLNKSGETPEKSDSGGFSFGEKAPNVIDGSQTAASSFSFGAKSSEPTKNEAFSFGSAFGAKPVEGKVSEKESAEFSFGAKPSTSEAPTSTSGAQAPLGSFAFGATPADKKSTEIPEKKTPVLSNPISTDKSSVLDLGGIKATETGNSFPSSLATKRDSRSDPVTHLDETSGSGSSGAASPTRSSPSKEYLAHLKALNMQVASWINKHLEQNPLVLLTPVFKDYDKHLVEITEKYKGEEAPNKEVQAPLNSTPSSTFSLAIKDTDSSKALPSFGNFGASSEKPKPTSAAAPFSFGVSSSNNSSTPPSLPAFAAFSSGSVQPAASSASTGFSFGNLSSAPQPTVAAPEAAKEDDEDSPPVVEIKQVTEDDAKYSKKCKLFFKKDGSYVEKGVGMLYIKAVEGEKHQLLIRADTNLGNVLLNILLSSQIPTTRVGKNNVMLVCVPNPPVDPKQTEPAAPCPMLIRVKDGDAADELKAKIEECSGK